jgi:formylglycine-generating enzyme required for sulfatase activity
VRPFKILFKILFKRKNLLLGVLLGAALVLLGLAANDYTSSDAFCESCHVHPHATETWKLSTHYDNQRGIFVHCIECHLPPGRWDYFVQKTRLGLRDLYGKLFKDVSKIDWADRSRLEHAATYTFKDACLRCHANTFPLGMSEKGDEAHLYYSQRPDELRCINCHLHVGHYDENAQTGQAFGTVAKTDKEIFTEPAKVERFEDFAERIPGSSVAFDMIALPGGEFTLGSPESEPYRQPDEGPARKVKVSAFWMGKTEVSWNEYGAFYLQTASEGRTDTRRPASGQDGEVDAITGATPPYGNPDQGWGKGKRPAITMTHHAATVYCQWLSKVTGKAYRLPTEAEWEYACVLLRGQPEKFYQGPVLEQDLRREHRGYQPLCNLRGQQHRQDPGAFNGAAQSLRSAEHVRQRGRVLPGLVCA